MQIGRDGATAVNVGAHRLVPHVVSANISDSLAECPQVAGYRLALHPE